MSRAKLSTSEWELVKDAPYWVNQALAAADGRVSFLAQRREGKAFEKAVNNYQSSNALITDIISDDSDAAKAVKNASQADAEKALNRIANIVETKLGADDLAALRAFLLNVGNAVASATKEGGKTAVSEKESAALVSIESALKASASLTTAHMGPKPAAPSAKPSATSAKPSAAPVPPKRDDDAKAKEAEARLEKARQDAEKRRREANEARDADAAKARQEKAREEAEKRRREANEAREAEAAKAREEAARKEAEAQAAASAPKYTNFIAEHTVVAGDNLSFISERYYGTQANFRIIYEANKDVIGDNMNLIKPGQVLKIPKL